MKTSIFVHIEKDIDIYLIEYILLNQYDCYYYNDNDPYKETQHDLGELSDGEFHFLIYKHDNDEITYLSEIHNPGAIKGDYNFEGVEYPVITGSKLLRNYKINKIKKQLKK